MVNWLTNFVLPKIRAVVSKKTTTDNLWQKCPACEHMLFYRELEAHLHVCRNCGHHLRIGAAERLRILFDDSAFSRIELPKTIVDPLRFRDRRRYTDRLKEAQAAHGPGSDAVVVAHGRIGGHPAVVAAFEFGFMGGSMGIAAGEAMLAAAKLAVLQEATLIAVPASGGARMQEGALSLMQMPRTIIAADMVKEAGLPYIVLLSDPTTGGVSASFAMVGDITLAEPGAIIGFAGARVIEETIHEKLPDGFQRAEYLLDHGMVDMVVPRGELRATIGRLLGLLRDRHPGDFSAAGDAGGRMTAPTSDIVLARLTRLHPKLIDLSLGRVERLLAALGAPHEKLPPVIHVAGTNGKGSTVATMRACLEAGGYRVHAYISPHLVRFHERIRLAGQLIEEDRLIELLEECERANGGAPITYFEITAAAAFLAFARTPADIVLLETGLGGRLDATNVIRRPAATAITPISLDHQAFLGDTIAAIAGEKAGILKPRSPAIIGPQLREAASVIAARAAAVAAPLCRFGQEWRCEPNGGGMHYKGPRWQLDLPLPSLIGRAPDRQFRESRSPASNNSPASGLPAIRSPTACATSTGRHAYST